MREHGERIEKERSIVEIIEEGENDSRKHEESIEEDRTIAESMKRIFRMGRTIVKSVARASRRTDLYPWPRIDFHPSTLFERREREKQRDQEID